MMPMYSANSLSIMEWISISSDCQLDTKLPNPYVMLA